MRRGNRASMHCDVKKGARQTEHRRGAQRGAGKRHGCRELRAGRRTPMEDLSLRAPVVVRCCTDRSLTHSRCCVERGVKTRASDPLCRKRRARKKLWRAWHGRASVERVCAARERVRLETAVD
eukprot:2807416-Rhodomonas_salina.1